MGHKKYILYYNNNLRNFLIINIMARLIDKVNTKYRLFQKRN